MAKKWKHDELAHDLAEHLSNPARMVWEDMQIGPSGSPRPDVYTIQKSYTQPKPRVYEVKVSLSDFRSDVTKGKWQSYLEFSSGVTFCVPAGLITKADIPNGCGLMVRGEDGWKTLKAPTLQRVTLPERACLKLLIDGAERAARLNRVNYFNSHVALKAIKKKFGEHVCQVVGDTDGMMARAERTLERAESEAEGRIKLLTAQAERELKNAEQIRANAELATDQLREVLGVKTTYFGSVVSAAQRFKDDQSADSRLMLAKRELERARKSLDQAFERVNS